MLERAFFDHAATSVFNGVLDHEGIAVDLFNGVQ